MTKNRRDPTSAVPLRSGRIFQADGVWYLAKREQREEGPFLRKQEAEAELISFLRHATRAHCVFR